MTHRAFVLVGLFSMLLAGCGVEPHVQMNQPVPSGITKADLLANRVLQASGEWEWHKVSRLQFVFNVTDNGQSVMVARHDWDVDGGTDTVSWNGKTVKVDLKNPGDSEDEKAAFARWTNDSYWLLAPLKIKDPGVFREYVGRKTVGDRQFEVLRISFDKVGLTPGDEYDLYIDPETLLVRGWVYRPNPQTEKFGTWESYGNFGGMQLAQRHNFAGKVITFTEITVTQRTARVYEESSNSGQHQAPNSLGYTRRQAHQSTTPRQASQPSKPSVPR